MNPYIKVFKDNKEYSVSVTQTMNYGALCQAITSKSTIPNLEDYEFSYHNGDNTILLKNNGDLKTFIKGKVHSLYIRKQNVVPSLNTFDKKWNSQLQIEEQQTQLVIEQKGQANAPINKKDNNEEKDQIINQHIINRDEEKQQKQTTIQLQDNNNDNDAYLSELNKMKIEIEELKRENSIRKQIKAEKMIQINIEKQLLNSKEDKELSFCKDKINYHEIETKYTEVMNQNIELLKQTKNLENQLKELKKEQLQKINQEVSNKEEGSDALDERKFIKPSNLINDKSLIEIMENELSTALDYQNEYTSELNSSITQVTQKLNQSMSMSIRPKPSFTHQFKCCNCNEDINGIKYQCLLCSEYNICNVCLDLNISNTHQNQPNFHQHSTFIELKDANKHQREIKASTKINVTEQNTQLSHSSSQTIQKPTEENGPANQFNSNDAKLNIIDGNNENKDNNIKKKEAKDSGSNPIVNYK